MEEIGLQNLQSELDHQINDSCSHLLKLCKESSFFTMSTKCNSAAQICMLHNLHSLQTNQINKSEDIDNITDN